MYKITMYDENCCPICDGTTSFFTDDLVGFEEKWCPKADEAQLERYMRSKAGELVTDYYSDSPELNILQEDTEAREIFYRTEHLSQSIFELYNTYGWQMLIYAESADVQVKGIEFNQKYYVVGKYKLSGVCECLMSSDDTVEACTPAHVWGNPICESNIEKKAYWEETPEGRQRKTYKKEDFKDDTIETYCWVTIADDVSEEALHQYFRYEGKENFFAIFMRDIPGEAG